MHDFSFFEQEAYLSDPKSLCKVGLIAADPYVMLFADVCEVHWLLPIHIVLLGN